MRPENVVLSDDGRSVVIIDQTKLPGHTEYLALTTPEEETEATLLFEDVQLAFTFFPSSYRYRWIFFLPPLVYRFTWDLLSLTDEADARNDGIRAMMAVKTSNAGISSRMRLCVIVFILSYLPSAFQDLFCRINGSS